MFFEDAQFMSDLHSISPELTCTCDEVHTCQQCMIEDGYEPLPSETDEEFIKNMDNNHEINDQELSSPETDEHLEQ